MPAAKTAALPQSRPMAMHTTPAAPVKVAVLVYPGVELLDFSGPTEVFSNVAGAQVYLVSTGKKSLATKDNTVHLTADYTLATAPLPDILVVPGAPQEVVTGVYGDPAALAWVQKADQSTQLTMSVCTGAFILSKAGLTRHKRITTHWGAVDSLQRFDPQATVLKDQRFVEDGKLLTTAGVSAGIDGALRVVEELRGPDEARSVARIMQYDKWQPKQGVVLGHSGIRPPAPLAADVARDPVCEMAVTGQDAPTLAYKGVTYHFCSASCRENFRRHPDQYTKK
jgi:transcriptional regulator GlxA family with amidase domain/YHS domain-containing protein